GGCGDVEPVSGGGEKLSDLGGDQGRVIIDEQHVGHGLLTPGAPDPTDGQETGTTVPVGGRRRGPGRDPSIATDRLAFYSLSCRLPIFGNLQPGESTTDDAPLGPDVAPVRLAFDLLRWGRARSGGRSGLGGVVGVGRRSRPPRGSQGTATTMMTPRPANEAERLAALRALGVLDTPPEEGFDELTALAASICRAPIAIISLID